MSTDQLFAQTLVPLAELRPLMARSNKPAVRQIFGLVLALIGAGMLVWAARDSWVVWPAMFTMGLVWVHLFAAQHECAHRTAFRSMRANNWLAWVCGALIMVPALHFRYEHTAHHTHTNLIGQEGAAALMQWPPKGLEVLDSMKLPLLNTLILLCSGTTVTWAHHALIHGDREGLKKGLLATILLGLLFSCIQAYEYTEAPFPFAGLNYGTAFYMATGFHGFHVIVGTIFLAVCLVRANKGHFTPQQHFGFEAAAWYWHFVDVVWLFLFIAIYIWGGWGAPVHA